jgi:hypothetical protein
MNQTFPQHGHLEREDLLIHPYEKNHTKKSDTD